MNIKYNSPVVLNFTFISAVIMLLASIGLTGVRTFFSLPPVFNSTSPLSYFQLISHVFGHGSWEHLLGNFSFILLLGPILEEKYGSKKLMTMMFFTALVTGVLYTIFFSNGLMGASGIVFMMIILSSFTNFKDHNIPLTFILVSILFLGKEFYNIFNHDNISQFAHILGGIIGALFGFNTTKNQTTL